MINEYVNVEREALNTSTHDPILVPFSCNLEGKTQNPGVNYTNRIKWNKIDKQEYKNNVEAKLTTLQEINQLLATFHSLMYFWCPFMLSVRSSFGVVVFRLSLLFSAAI
jgi:hypothetical protein